MVKSNFYTRLYTKENRISFDSLGLLEQLFCWCVVLAKIGQRSVEQTIKAIDLSMLIVREANYLTAS
jgi:hypothetical protein